VVCLGVLATQITGARRAHREVFVLGPDTPAPAVSIIWPEDGAVLGGDVSVFVPSRDGLGLARVDVFLDDTLRIGSLPGGVYALSWNTRGIPWGAHTLTARAYDTSGRTITSVPVNVTVGAPLTVAVSSPEEGAVRSGTLSLSAAVEHARGGAWVQFLTEDRYLCGVRDAPYTCDAPTESLPNGPLQVRAEVYDDAGNHALSEWVTVSLENDRTASSLGLPLPASRVTAR
jgi:hypothetical protein